MYNRLFIGGYYYMQIQSVRVRATNNNYKDIIYALAYLDTILTGGEQYNVKVSASDISVMKHLFNSHLNQTSVVKFDSYICDTFAAFIQSKQQISLDLYELYRANSEIRELLMYEMDEKDTFNGEKEVKRGENDFSNLFRAEMFLIFKNVKTLIIKSTHGFGNKSYSLGMECLLSLVHSTSLKQVIVKAYTHWKENKDTNWIYSLWTENKEAITKQYEMKQYNISMKEIKGEWANGYCFKISKF